jgi:glutamate-ammonia-ligase adenylyltransferase
VSGSLRERLVETIADTPLARSLSRAAEVFLAQRGGDAAASRVDGQALQGLARVLATQPEMASFLSHRPEFLSRVASLGPDSLAEREAQLPHDVDAVLQGDLESSLDALRVRRREEMAFAACVDLAGIAPFEDVSDFLSVLAETTAQFALRLARDGRAEEAPDDVFAVIGMGKIAGREFTYHSDLDLIFLYRGGPEWIGRATRSAQRLISYLTTMTGAGIAYAVDTRLRPSGRQGMLVTSFEAFERYQMEKAQIWEHLAILRARPIAGDTDRVAHVLERVRDHVFSLSESPWAHLSQLRSRVERERGVESTGSVALKTGAGGLMDVDFLAGGGLIERGTDAYPALPSVRAMLRACVEGDRVDALLRDYRLLRIVEARARWIAGRAVETLEAGGDELPLVAELVEPGLEADALLERIREARRRTRADFDEVVLANSISALEA